ncbi:MAG: transglutaminase family protein [Gloeomargaritaceae cyanobacterium C42_A2020_066]|nr:transglutaminase family protein [Gloeomargaritaceae cyanobacterium C42_A2020_066]
MTIKVVLQHRLEYQFDRPVRLSPHLLRLRPAAHNRIPISGYTLRISPEDHRLHSQVDPLGNTLDRLVFQTPSTHLRILVELIAELYPRNPFDFLLVPEAQDYPFSYSPDQATSLAPFLQPSPQETSALMTDWLAEVRPAGPQPTVNFLVGLNQRLSQTIAYTTRLEPGVQPCDTTLSQKLGSCRDSSWLLVQTLRHLGLAARFVSGYLVQLVPEEPALEGAAGPTVDSADLHAWAEVYLPGAGWIGLDPTSGLLTAEGHIPLAVAVDPSQAAPVEGTVEPCNATLNFQVAVTRLQEVPTPAQPYTEDQWQQILALGETVETRLKQGGVNLWMGGEPTFVAADNRDAPEWLVAALGDDKLQRGEHLLRRLRDRFAPGGWLLMGQGKTYAGEPLPRWSLSCYWRPAGAPLWQSPDLEAIGDTLGKVNLSTARTFIETLAQHLGVAVTAIHPAQDAERGFVGFVLPLLRVAPAGRPHWITCTWQFAQPTLALLPGNSPLGYRLPLDRFNPDTERLIEATVESLGEAEVPPPVGGHLAAPDTIAIALTVEVRAGRLCVFFPPLSVLDHYLALVTAVETVARALNQPIRCEGYPPPTDARLQQFQITPDPGVLEVNIHPAAQWPDWVTTVETLYTEAQNCGLAAEKYLPDGRRVGTGGGSHLTLGGSDPATSPLLRRPDLLRSLLTYWQHHPSLSYLFSGLFVGPTCQAPRVDEGRHESLYELEIAFQELTVGATPPPWLVDRLLRHLLVDVTGNTHRAEFCIDKLYPVEHKPRRLGLLELRAMEMPPHPQMALTLALLVRALVVWLWETPYHKPLVRWGASLHDRFMLPHFLVQDLVDVLKDLAQAGLAFEPGWFTPFVEFRCPVYGQWVGEGVLVELRQALEPWPVLGEEVTQTGTARYVDSSLERLQVRVQGYTPGRHQVTCNGRPLPLQPTGIQGEAIAGVRFRAHRPAAGLHPAIDPHVPLVFDLVDTWRGRSLGGCTYYAGDPQGQEYLGRPVNAREAEARLRVRFVPAGHTPGPVTLQEAYPSPECPLTLDLRRA